MKLAFGLDYSDDSNHLFGCLINHNIGNGGLHRQSSQMASNYAGEGTSMTDYLPPPPPPTLSTHQPKDDNDRVWTTINTYSNTSNKSNKSNNKYYKNISNLTLATKVHLSTHLRSSPIAKSPTRSPSNPIQAQKTRTEPRRPGPSPDPGRICCHYEHEHDQYDRHDTASIVVPYSPGPHIHLLETTQARTFVDAFFI
ncbi:hypothetical protein KI688_012022 [Linnemannia hyalina]|uniref:Uncharacterized protein n=1 Tax=Linnemannia hyalina TaxID=64524 RepID=A0A9P8BT45_9FUNG|nr:hypothetical protein KI688_012022 [Linnemannia hyalina]